MISVNIKLPKEYEDGTTDIVNVQYKDGTIGKGYYDFNESKWFTKGVGVVTHWEYEKN